MAHLPVDIWFHIVEFLPPCALDALDATSRSLSKGLKSSPIMKRHHVVTEKYRHCVCGRNQPHGPLTELAVDVFLNPSLSYYIKKLTVIDWYNHLQRPDWRRYYYLRNTSYQETLNAGLAGKPMLEDWLSNFNCVSGTFVLLLWALSELRCLNLRRTPHRPKSLAAIMNEARGRGYKPFGPARPPMLPKLESTNLSETSPDRNWPAGTIEAFAAISSGKVTVANDDKEFRASDNLSI